ncbi:MAG: hypothetical protein Q4A07_10045 [Coriobacteriales bacterium]|nr:hypothetical protein [Coriobacteriales bacterium]
MNRHCYEDSDLAALFDEYEKTFGIPYPKDFHDGVTPLEAKSIVRRFLEAGKPVPDSRDANGIRYWNKQDEYRCHFGEMLGKGFSAPETDEEIYALACKCIARGKAFDPREDAGIPEDAII